MRSVTVLIAEDERTARTSLAGLLEAEGFQVLTAENGTEALSLLHSGLSLRLWYLVGIDGS